MAKAFEVLKKVDEKLGPVSEALLKTPEGQKAAERVDELRKKAEGISKKLEEGSLNSLVEASQDIGEMMETPEGVEVLGFLKKLHLKGLMKTAEFFHDHPKVLKSTRKAWESLPEIAKDGLLASRFGIVGYNSLGKLLNSAAHLGIIERSEEDLAAMAKNENAAANGAVVMGTALGVGEIVAPVAEYAKAYDKMAYENYAKARRYFNKLEAEGAAEDVRHKKLETLKKADASDSAARVAEVKKKLSGVRGNGRTESAN